MASARGAFRELITDGVNGVLFQPDAPAALADALWTGGGQRDDVEEYGAQARKTEQRFNPVDSMQELLGITGLRLSIQSDIQSQPQYERELSH